MKTNKIIFCLLAGIIFWACNDTIGSVGLGIQPGEDKINVFDTTVVVGARTIEVDSIYAKTPAGLLGNYYDPSYGNIKCSYMCQYYPSIGFPYLDSIMYDKIDSVRLNIYYTSFIGDSLTPMEVTVYPVVKPLINDFYTTANPADYCDFNNPITKYSYTARNKNVSDSLLQANGTYYISIPLPVKFGQDYLDKVKNNELKTVDEFLNYFPGTYLATTFGTGNLLPINATEINLYYTRKTIVANSEGVSDSTVYVASRAVFTVTTEVIQLNKFENKNPSFLTEDNPDKTYLKSPAGVFTELTIPIREIANGIGNKKFSSVALSLKAYPKDDWNYSLSFPGMPASTTDASTGYMASSGYQPKLLLIEPDSVKNFFEMKKIADSKTSYTTQFSSSSYTYDFSNIANLIQNAIDKAPDKDLKLWIIPVLTTWYSASSSSGYTYPIDYMTSHYIYPSGVTLKKGGDNLKIRVVATNLSINN
jgi:hypothetical protein